LKTVTPSIKLENLLSSPLVGAKGTEVVVSHVTVPPHSQLPRHWHPGEEFAYVIEGSVTLWQKGKEDIVCKKGDAAMVPWQQEHTIMTQDEGVTLLVFRVHQQGQPERILTQ